ncbi:MAG TPA: alkaline phosphatase family protein [Streptosporangiaceae bacterium]|nr:alkaline phosphatase family protein [Streptosporangiaceae bacterium]
MFATYQPPNHQHIWNLLSGGIVNRNGTPGPNYARATQLTAVSTKNYTLTPKITGTYKTLPRPNTTYVVKACDGQQEDVPDNRFPATRPDGPDQITTYVPYWDSHSEYSKYGQCEFSGAYAGDPLHRFYQMYQQSAAYHDRLATWVPNTAGDDNGALPPGPIDQGGSYSECADSSAPGVSAVDAYLNTLPYQVLQNCQPGRYYLLNNDNPYYQPNGKPYLPGYNVPAQKSDFVTVGQSLSGDHISWGWFGEGYDASAPGGALPEYCTICDPMEYSSYIMTNPGLRKDTEYRYDQFISDAVKGRLPSVSFLRPGDDDGRPGYSTLAASENFVARAVSAVQDNPAEWKFTAIFVTEDESGGYYDSGCIQPVSFFGDGPRVPLIAISPYAGPGFAGRTYTDHVSLLKFIEANWQLPPLTSYSEDNLPNATPYTYVPKVRPAIGSLMTMFQWSHPDFAPIRLTR